MTVLIVGGVSCWLAVWAHLHAARENRARSWRRVAIFDAWRAAGVVASGWVFGCVLALAEPYVARPLGPLPVAWPVTLELAVVLGVLSFAWYTWSRRYGWHTWQRYPHTAAPCA